MTITQQTVQELKQNITPAQAIEYYTGHAVRRNKCLCPFHNDRNPSLHIKGYRWTCFVCDIGGDVIAFTQQYFGIGFRDAVAKLCNDFGIVTEQPVQSKADRERIMCDRIKRESDRENKMQLRSYLDSEIEILNACHRILIRCNAPGDVVKRYADELDDMIQERSRLGESDWRAMLTPGELELSEQLRTSENKVDPELVELIAPGTIRKLIGGYDNEESISLYELRTL